MVESNLAKSIAKINAQSPAMLQATGLRPQTLAVCPRPSCSQTLRVNRTNPAPRSSPTAPAGSNLYRYTPDVVAHTSLRFATFRDGSYVYATPSSLRSSTFKACSAAYAPR